MKRRNSIGRLAALVAAGICPLVAIATGTSGIKTAPATRPAGPAAPQAVTRAFVIPIREPITTKTFDALKRKAVLCRARRAELIIFDMDTWGGDAIAALDIARLMKTELKNIHTVCYARTRAVSAGAMIAVSCDEIVMTPIGSLGDCAPISPGSKLEGVRREKIETELRREFRESAKRNGYNLALSQSMVSSDLEVWLIRHKKSGEQRYVLKNDWKGRVETPHDEKTDRRRKKYDWQLVRIIVPKGKLLTMDSTEAREYGFVRNIIDTGEPDPLADLLAHYHVKVPPEVLADTWSERLVEFLTHPAVMGLLFFVGLLCGYVEMHTPGFGVAGSVAIVCFAILFGGQYLSGLAQWWEIALFIVGLVLLGVEIFITPGFGIMGISGALCCLVAILAMLVGNAPDELPWPDSQYAWDTFTNGVLWLMAAFVAATVAAALLGRYLPKIPVANRLVLATPQPTIQPPTAEDSPIRRVREGQVGIVTQTCRPVGKVRIDGELLDAVADGAFLEGGTEIVVLRNEGNRVVIDAKG